MPPTTPSRIRTGHSLSPFQALSLFLYDIYTAQNLICVGQHEFLWNFRFQVNLFQCPPTLTGVTQTLTVLEPAHGVQEWGQSTCAYASTYMSFSCLLPRLWWTGCWLKEWQLERRRVVATAEAKSCVSVMRPHRSCSHCYHQWLPHSGKWEEYGCDSISYCSS